MDPNMFDDLFKAVKWSLIVLVLLVIGLAAALVVTA